MRGMEVKKHIPFSGDGGQVAPEGFHGVMVSTLDSESSNPSSNLGGTFLPSWKKNTFYSLNRIGPARGLPRASVAGSHGHGGQGRNRFMRLWGLERLQSVRQAASSGKS